MDIIVQTFLVFVTTVTGYFIVKEMFGSALYGAFGAMGGAASASRRGLKPVP